MADSIKADYAALRAMRVQVVSIHIPLPKEALQALVKEFNIEWPQLVDNGSLISKFTDGALVLINPEEQIVAQMSATSSSIGKLVAEEISRD